MSQRIRETARERGALSFELILYVAALGVAIAIVASILQIFSERRENATLAAELKRNLNAAQNMTSDRYDDMRDAIFTDSDAAGAPIVKAYTLTDLADEGFLPPGVVPGTGPAALVYGKGYTLLARLVSATDTNVPAATLAPGAMDTDGDGVIDSALTDGLIVNDEVEIEAVLVTTGGTAVGELTANKILAGTEKLSAGFVAATDTASGLYANFTFDISGFSASATYPAPGDFASLVALANYGAFSGGGTGEAFDPGAFQRCQQMIDSGNVTIGDSDYQDCLDDADGNAIYSDIVMTSYTDTGGNTIYPEIRGVGRIEMDPTGPQSISNVEGLGCGSPVSGMTPGQLWIDCGETGMTGNLTVAGNSTTGGDALVQGNSIVQGDTQLQGDTVIDGTTTVNNELVAQRLRQDLDADGTPDFDLATATQSVQTVVSGSTVAKPTCPASMTPKISVSFSSFSGEQGIPTVGVRPWILDVGPTSWRVEIYNFVAEDICTANFTDDATGADGSPPNTIENACDIATSRDIRNGIGAPAPDGFNDYYEVGGSFGRALAHVACE